MIELPYKQEVLKQKITVPSEVHGYSLAVEYMRNWFITKFNDYFKPVDENGKPTDFFKTIYINGKHVFDDFRRYNKSKEEYHKTARPALQITPVPNIDNDRRGLKFLQNMMGPDLYYQTSIDYGKFFFYDSENKIKIILSMDVLEVAFNFKIRVDTLAKQIDIFRFMNLYFRVGDTQSEYLDMDFNIPEDIIIQIASQAGFLKDGKVDNSMEFLRYLNLHSKLPITYKLRTINGRGEYFVRVPQLYTHINNTDKLDRDDGERVGMTTNNFNIEMNSILTIPVPLMYCYLTTVDKIKTLPTVENADLGLYTFKLYDIPSHNSRGWETYVSTQVALDNAKLGEEEFEIVNIKPLLDSIVLEVSEFNKSKLLSPEIFIDIQSFTMDQPMKVEVDWETYDVKIYGPLLDWNEGTIDLVVYMDMEYVNTYLNTKNKNQDSRLAPSK